MLTVSAAAHQPPPSRRRRLWRLELPLQPAKLRQIFYALCCDIYDTKEPLMDPISATFMTFGVILLFASWVYLMIIAFREDFTWGLCTVLVPPLAYVYSFFAWRKSKEVLILAAIGVALVLFAL
jgi:hypothetical protein